MPLKWKKKREKRIASERIELLFSEAERAFTLHPSRSHRYVEIARNIATRTRTRIPKPLRRRICSHCGKFLVPGTNTRVRTREGKIVVKCLECNHLMRYHFVKERKEKRKRKEKST